MSTAAMSNHRGPRGRSFLARGLTDEGLAALPTLTSFHTLKSTGLTDDGYGKFIAALSKCGTRSILGCPATLSQTEEDQMPPVDEPSAHDDPTETPIRSGKVEPFRLSAPVRVDDNARKTVAEELARHFADGRLDLGEYEERVEHAYAARFDTDLAAVTADLPSIVTSKKLEQRRTKAKAKAKTQIGSWLGLVALFVLIWALTDPTGYFWPVWPMLGTGIGILPSAYAEWNRSSHPDP